MAKNLLIVESPAKAKTIEKILGSDFHVTSCYGHIRDLKKKGIAIDVENDFHPEYEVPADKKDLVKQLKKMRKEHDEVWLATDEDREGEAISWHLCEVLDLDEENTKRIVFHEITKPALLEAVKNPRKLNKNLVDAQQARRILDRLVGFELSPVLWRKISATGLSAGRVQSVSVRIIVEQEKEIKAFNSESSYKLTAFFSIEDKGETKEFKAELPKRIVSIGDASLFLNSCVDAIYKIEDVKVKPATKKPSPPFTTSTLQQDASRKFGYSVVKTMMLAQRLYEGGHITYMRTDSVNMSQTANENAANTISSNYGENYVQVRHFTTKAKDAQEAHEAIRPTYFDKEKAGDDESQQRLYSLIWKRAIASQMADAKLEKTTAEISISTREEILVAKGEVLTFDGFLKVYQVSKENEEAEGKLLPPLVVGDNPSFIRMNAVERFSRPPARYSEASLVKKMEELGIGRPSTYAPTISTIQKRNYVEKKSIEGKVRDYQIVQLESGLVSTIDAQENTGAEKNKLFPTDIGIVVNDFLVEYFDEVVNYGFTANIEEEFDRVSRGETTWKGMIGSFYSDFHPMIEHALEHAERASGERELGVDPKSGRPMIARLGKFGPMVQIGKAEDEDKPRFAGMRPGQSIGDITLEEALKLFDLPREVGEFEGEMMKVNIGRFGPYVMHNKKFVSIPKGTDIYNVDGAMAKELILQKREIDAKKLIKKFEEDETIQILNGRWGPYIKAGKQNVKIPKDLTPEDLTFELVTDLIKNAPPPKKKGARK